MWSWRKESDLLNNGLKDMLNKCNGVGYVSMGFRLGNTILVVFRKGDNVILQEYNIQAIGHVRFGCKVGRQANINVVEPLADHALFGDKRHGLAHLLKECADARVIGILLDLNQRARRSS